ncbi:PriCT-2 domain-containing protein [Xanthobacter flavus]|uniref:PriCT-2 domain-containing protein n=1 Tax=Xanthobacter flavus TaxID=281 RepID=UPI002490D283|nr:PriCT-2 domain-containing protein [Xanthobacter flavus]
MDLVKELGAAFDVTSTDLEDSTLDQMQSAKRWLLSRDKRPFYIDGSPRGATDTDEDRVWLATYDEAMVALSARGAGWLLGFALGPDGSGGHWQGIDFDDIEKHKHGIASRDWALRDASLPGYVELSPSKKGIHVIGYGRAFTNLGSNGTGIEAYANGRFFTFTGDSIRDGVLTDLADYVEQTLAPLHGAARASSASTGVHEVTIDPQTVTELRSALNAISPDDYGTWIAMGHALREIGARGRELWLSWSQQSAKWRPGDARKWDTFGPTDTGYQAVFAEAQRQGWVNPKSKAAQGAEAIPVNPEEIRLEFAMLDSVATLKLDYLFDPFLPVGCVVGFYGRGSSAKTSLLASMAAQISHWGASTLWLSVEELTEWIKVRHVNSGGIEETLAVLAAVPIKKNAQGHVISSSINVYDHLEPAIGKARADFKEKGKPPLRFVVLDTAVGLTAWGKGESPNDDSAVKKLLAFLQALAEKHSLTIAIVGHANKGTHEHFADIVMGASAWVNSPRLSFVHAEDRREPYSYVMRTAKSNLGAHFGMMYKTVPVHVLHRREWADPDGSADVVLCKIQPSPIVWGNSGATELWEDATTKPKDEGEAGMGRAGRATIAAKLLECLVKVVHASDHPVSRHEVHYHFGREVHGKEWTKVEDRLRLGQFTYKVEIDRTDKNRALYRKVA